MRKRTWKKCISGVFIAVLIIMVCFSCFSSKILSRAAEIQDVNEISLIEKTTISTDAKTMSTDVSGSDAGIDIECELEMEDETEEISTELPEEADAEFEIDTEPGILQRSVSSGTGNLSGTLLLGESVDYSCGSGVWNQLDDSSSVIIGSAMNKNDSSLYVTYATSKSADSYILYPGGAYGFIDGHSSLLDVKVYYWSEQGIAVPADYLIGFQSLGDMNNNAYAEFHFYKAGTTDEVSWKGFNVFNDLDYHEGIEIVNGLVNYYTSSGTSLVWNGSLIEGTQESPVDAEGNQIIYNDEQALGATMEGSSTSPLLIRYHYRDGVRGASAIGRSYALTYVLLDRPSGVEAPEARRFSIYTDILNNLDDLFAHTNYSGYTFSGWYTNKDLSGPPYTGTVLMTNNVTIYGTYTPQIGSLTITKNAVTGDIDINDISVQNKSFSFTLSGISAAGDTVNLTKSIVGEGTVTFSDIPVGTYTLKENYNENIWKSEISSSNIIISADKTVNVTATNTLKSGSLIITKKVVTGDADINDISVQNKSFSFTLSGTSAAGDTVNLTKSIVGEGTVTFSNIPVGTYTLKENYNENVWKSEISSSDIIISADKTVNVTATNTLQRGSAEIVKSFTDKSGYIDSKKGFKFRLYGFSQSGIKVDIVGTTDEDGILLFKDVLAGTYSVEEIGTPDSTDILPSWWDCYEAVREVTIEDNSTVSFSVNNIYKTGSVSVQKIIPKHNSTSTYNKELSNIDSLEGFAFRLSGISDSGIEYECYEVTNEKGIATFSDVPVGNYDIVEVSVDDIKRAAKTGNLSAWTAYLYSSKDLQPYLEPISEKVIVTYDETKHIGQTVNVLYENKFTLISITKLVLNMDTYNTGATLQILNSAGDVVDEWITTDSEHIIEGLKVGATYTLHESKVSPGYVTAEDVTFVVEGRKPNGDYQMQHVKMEDDIIKVKIWVFDGLTDEELEGVSFYIGDNEGNITKLNSTDLKYCTDGTYVYIEGVPIGEYVIYVTDVPDGYVLPDAVKFTVKDTGEVQNFQVYVYPYKPQVSGSSSSNSSDYTAPAANNDTQVTITTYSAKTGDTSNFKYLVLVAGITVLLGGVFGGLAVLSKQKGNKRTHEK